MSVLPSDPRVRAAIRAHQRSYWRSTTTSANSYDAGAREIRVPAVSGERRELVGSATTGRWHLPVIDLDLAATLEATGRGGFRLCVEQDVARRRHERAVRAMVRAGLVERNWYRSLLGNTSEKWRTFVVDLAVPALLVPSKTPGHFHLFIEREVTGRAYRAILRALVRAGVVERAWYRSVKHWGQGFVAVTAATPDAVVSTPAPQS